WTFLNTSSAIFGAAGAAGCGLCARTAGRVPATVASITTAAPIACFDPNIMDASLLLLRRGGAPALLLFVEFLQAALEAAVELGVFARIPVAAVALLARFVEVLADVPHLVDVFPLGDLHRFERDVPERLDARVPFDGIALDLRGDLRRRQFDGMRTLAVVLVARRRERAAHLQQVRAFGQRDGADADLFPVLSGLRHVVHDALLRDRRADGIEEVVRDRVDHVLHQFFDRYDRFQIAPEHGGLGRRRRFRRGTRQERRADERDTGIDSETE